MTDRKIGTGYFRTTLALSIVFLVIGFAGILWGGPDTKSFYSYVLLLGVGVWLIYGAGIFISKI